MFQKGETVLDWKVTVLVKIQGEMLRFPFSQKKKI